MQPMSHRIVSRRVIFVLRVCTIGALSFFAFLYAPPGANALVIATVFCGTAVGGPGIPDALSTCSGPLSNPWRAQGSAAARVGDTGEVGGMTTMSLSDADSRTSPSRFVSDSWAEYFDDITINVASMDPGEIISVAVSLQIDGTTDTQLLDVTAGLVVARAEMRLLSRGAFQGSVSLASENGVLVIDRPMNTFNISFQNGIAKPLSLRLTTQAAVMNNLGVGSASAEANFLTTGGITGFEYFALDGTPVSGTFSSASGQFAFYNPIPEPGTGLLLSLGLILMAWSPVGCRK